MPGPLVRARGEGRHRTVVELAEVRVEAPLVDGARASFTTLGFFTSFDTASAWLRQRVAESEPDDGALVYYSAEEVVLDHRRRVCNVVTYDRDGTLRGKVSGGAKRPWGGREPAACRYKPGDIVGLVGVAYRIGVVLGLPPSPDEARRSGDVTRGDDLYLAGIVDRDDPFDPDRWDHEHVTEVELFDAPSDVPDVLRDALRHRCLGTEAFPEWTEDKQRALRDPDAVISRMLARFQSEGARGPAGATRATLVLDKSVFFLTSALREANFQIVEIRDRADDFETRRNLLAHRTVVTKTTADYLDLAPVLDYGVIGLDALPRLHGEVEYANNPTAQLISRAVAEFALVGERGGWVILLHPDGNHVFRTID